MIKKTLVILLKKLDILSSISMRLVQLTGKHRDRIHPKHLINTNIWYEKYLSKKMKVLDLGCGDAFALIKVSKKIKKGIGLDFDLNSLENAINEANRRKVKNLKFIQHDANKPLPFKEAYFNAVICSDVLEHLNKRDQALREIIRVLKHKGLLLLVNDNPNTSWKKLQKSVGLFYYADQDHKYEYSRDEIIMKLKKSELKILSIKPVTYDTPFKGIIDLVGGISLTFYAQMRKWKKKMVVKNPVETTGFMIVAEKIK